MSLLLNMLSGLVIIFLPRSKCLLISWLQSPSAVIWEPRKRKSATVSPSICHEVMGPDAMILVFWMLSFKPTFLLPSFTFIKWVSSLHQVAKVLEFLSRFLAAKNILLATHRPFLPTPFFPGTYLAPTSFSAMTFWTWPSKTQLSSWELAPRPRASCAHMPSTSPQSCTHSWHC